MLLENKSKLNVVDTFDTKYIKCLIEWWYQVTNKTWFCESCKNRWTIELLTIIHNDSIIYEFHIPIQLNITFLFVVRKQK